MVLIFCVLESSLCPVSALCTFSYFSSVQVTERPPIGEELPTRLVFLVYVPKWCHFSFFPPLGLWSGNFFLIVLFPDYFPSITAIWLASSQLKTKVTLHIADHTKIDCDVVPVI